MRSAVNNRKTGETSISIKLCIDGNGESKINTGIGFFDHMLTLFARHGMFDLVVTAKGDTEVDEHHTIEDTGIALGEAFAKAMGDKTGISRYATQFLPMDETMAFASADISGRAYLVYNVQCPEPFVGGVTAQVFEEFFRAFVTSARITLHTGVLYGANTHHMIEAVFKAVARALRFALEEDPRCNGVPSTKGVL